MNNETVFELAALPPSLLAIGGGPLGCELAQAFARFGSRTIICHSEPLFLPKEERDAAQMVCHALAHDAVEIHLNCTVVAFRGEGGRKLHDVVRAITDGEEAGFVKIHVREGTDRILGATIVGRTAGELINTISLAMLTNLGLGRLVKVIHAYPTQGEAVRQAAQACALSLAPPVLMRKRETM